MTEAERQLQLQLYLASIPEDDEPTTADDIAAIEDGKAAIARGETVSATEVARIVDGAPAPSASHR